MRVRSTVTPVQHVTGILASIIGVIALVSLLLQFQDGIDLVGASQRREVDFIVC